MGGAQAVDWLERGRSAWTEHAWNEAYEALTRADAEAPLSADDLELLGVVLYMLGRIEEFGVVLERAYKAHLDAGETLRAARAAFYLGISLMQHLGEPGRATGWFARGQRLVEREGGDSAERGYLLMPVVLRNEASGNHEVARAAASTAAELGERFGDPDLFCLGTQAEGRLLIKQRQVAQGLALLDEAMLTATTGELSPIVTGVVYCGVIAACEEAYEPGRAREWTDALSGWCDAQPDMVAFSGTCLAHRAEIKQLHGQWADALDEARRARDRAQRGTNRASTGQALYQQGQVQRLRGDFAAAEAAYREANAHGREPQPGLALLRLAQGDVATAAASIRRALAETVEPLKRARLLPADVEIMLACGDVAEARTACDELTAIAAGFDSAMLGATVEYVRGSVELAEGDAAEALVSLRRAWQAWQELGAPYEAARTRVLVAHACRALGDDDTAALELEAARTVFAQLGAGPDLAALAAPAERDMHGLTQRELEVLRLVAAGRSNREIAAELVVSEHTVARHVQNILAKLSVSSRTGATAFAFEHDLM
ncbi:MAG TPA: LuxR C-terminal-related transcriptional regulator [Gaiellaceae bacterium]|jgi:DNA-binding CsgD family transcriptional regulator